MKDRAAKKHLATPSSCSPVSAMLRGTNLGVGLQYLANKIPPKISCTAFSNPCPTDNKKRQSPNMLFDTTFPTASITKGMVNETAARTARAQIRFDVDHVLAIRLAKSEYSRIRVRKSSSEANRVE